MGGASEPIGGHISACRRKPLEDQTPLTTGVASAEDTEKQRLDCVR